MSTYEKYSIVLTTLGLIIQIMFALIQSCRTSIQGVPIKPQEQMKDQTKSSEQNRFGEWLFQARTQRGWTRKNLADELLRRLVNTKPTKRLERLAPNTNLISLWERGTHKPCRIYRQLLCEIFIISEEELINLLS